MINNLKKILAPDKPVRRFVQCKTLVDNSRVRRSTINGVEHIIVPSMTLPDDIVMNGGLYPADEIEKSFTGLERTLAPIEHPVDEKGNFIPASDPVAINNFYGGAYNQNVVRNNGVVYIDKVINVQEALKTDRGRRLLDRIKNIENDPGSAAIHTSVGLFVEVEESQGVNKSGDEYTWIARNMVFDHDAILLDSAGAATPEQGVGMAINGKVLEVINSLITIESPNASDMSMNEIQDALHSAILETPINGDCVVDFYSDRVIYLSGKQLFSVPYVMDGRKARIAGIPIPVDRDVAYIPKTNDKGDLMKEMILNALKEAGVNAEGLTDVELFAKYNDFMEQENQEKHCNNNDQGGNTGEDHSSVQINNTLKALLEKLQQLESKVNASEEAELESLVSVIVNSDKYTGIKPDEAKKLGIETLKAMAASCNSAAGIPLSGFSKASDDDYVLPA